MTSAKKMDENNIPKIAPVEYNKMVRTEPISRNEIMKNRVDMPVPAIPIAAILGSLDMSKANGMLKKIMIASANAPDANEVICAILLESSLPLTYLQILMSSA